MAISYPVKQAVRICRYGSLININPSGRSKKWEYRQCIFDPPRLRPNRWSLFSHRVSVRPYKNKNALQHWRPENKIRFITDTMCVDNDHLLAVAWWVTLKSLDLFLSYSQGRRNNLYFQCLEKEEKKWFMENAREAEIEIWVWEFSPSAEGRFLSEGLMLTREQ